ncbi:AAA family ATPase [Stenotrophomonas sp. MMGLT7]|uniref:AAA family ATPase n=1 Tax=Stenotrophomonas sp. MMGLT7 TaxID=2901227 RepID=UPI001E3CF738|nr:AAA family ATPase [Stenotrophomonas sp. MMGLT7]MCD7098048.1 AAA family ATPase [Stenotrophomonas sp. MMGLT7]
MGFPLPHQLILFGPPGTSKSHLARTEKADRLRAAGANMVPVTFHPDYNYGEFVARLLPLTRDGRISYDVHAGPFIRALALAYIHLSQQESEQDVGNVLLLIDEINRGNCAEIFGDIFQLLDRTDEGWSSYDISASELTLVALRAEIERSSGQPPPRVRTMLDDRRLKLPPNLFLIGTMNTSDESVFFMDSAFKRRWNFEFRSVGFDDVPASQRLAAVTQEPYRSWSTLVDALNAFILAECPSPNLDDKLIGPWFIKARAIDGQTLSAKFEKELEKLKQLAAGASKLFQGAENSEAFERALLDFADNSATAFRKRILEYARYDPDGERKLKAIAYNKPSLYYLSRHAKKHEPPKDGTMLIEDFVDGLGKLYAEKSTHTIDHGDIVGKLFLYLWDNVFERDKSPLARKLDLPGEDLRTFSQFVERAETFIERLCPTAQSSEADRPASVRPA